MFFHNGIAIGSARANLGAGGGGTVSVTHSKTVVMRQSYAVPCCTRISDASTTTDLGSDDTLVVGQQAGGTTIRALLAFDVDSLGIPASATVTSAKVRMTTEAVNNTTARNISLHRALVEIYPGDGSGTANYSTWANRNQLTTTAWSGGAGGGSGSDYAAVATDTTSVQYVNREYEWDVTADVQDFIDGTASDYGWFVINDDEATAGSDKSFHAEFTTSIEGNPYLIIEYTESVDAPSADWYADGWSYRKEITIDSANVASDLTNFPLLVDLSGDADVTANSAAANYRDVLFTDSDGLTKLEHELAGHPWEIAADSGAYIWFGSPSAVHHVGTNNKTYIAYVNSTGDIAINAYDHTGGAWDGEFTLSSAFEYDDHAKPAILVRDSDSKIMVFWTGHSDNEMRLRVSTAAEDISAFDAEQTLNADIGNTGLYEYVTPIQLTGEVNDPIYLFWSANATDRRLRYSKSTDGGANWSAFTEIYDPTRSYMYYAAVRNGTDRIDFAVTNGEPGTDSDTDIGHFYYNGGNFYQSDGTQIVAAQPYAFSDLTTVHDGGVDGNAWIWDIAIDGSGNPVMAYAVIDGPGKSDHRYWYGKWNGSSWDTNEITTAGDGIKFAGSGSTYSGGITLNQDNVNEVWVSKPKAGVHNIVKYSTADGGSTWTEGAQLTGSTTLPHIRPTYVRNAHADLEIFWMYGYYPEYNSFQTAILCDLDTASAKFWVKIPTVTSATDTTFYVYYGNASASVQATDEMVWDGVYDLVLHGWWDRKFYPHYSTPPRSVSETPLTRAAREQDGTVYKEINMAGTSEAINMSTINMRGWAALTVEILAEHDSSGSNEHTLVDNTGSARPGLLFRVEPTNDTLEGFVRTTGAFPGGTFTGLTATANAVKRYALRYNSANGLEAFADKSKSTNSFGSGNGTLETGDNSNELKAALAAAAATDALAGTVEEIRISQNYHSDDWLDFVYDNMMSNATTITAGTEETA